MAEAKVVEWKAGELTGKNKAQDQTVLIDDIGGDESGQKTD